MSKLSGPESSEIESSETESSGTESSGNKSSKILTGTCHCQSVAFNIPADTDFSASARCDCSFCRRRWAATASVAFGRLEVTRGKDALTLYTFNTGTARHYFCRRCGIYTFHRRRSKPDEYGVNITCFDHVNIHDYANAPIDDGINHPSDRK